MHKNLPASGLCKEAASNDTGVLRHLVLDGLSSQAGENEIRIFFEKFGASAKVNVDKKKRRAFVTFSAAEAHQVSRAADAIYLQGGFSRLSFPQWSKKAALDATKSSRQMVLDGLPPGTSANDIRSLLGRFGASTKVEVDERLHQALATFSSSEAFHEVVSLAPLHLKGVDICIFILGDQKRSRKATPNKTQTSHQLFLNGLPPRTSENDIRSLFGRFGAFTKVEVDEQMHRALVTIYTAETFKKIMSSAPISFKGVRLLFSFPEAND
ncbi:Heterogeneou nuclear ribonucleoprotein D-like [Taenia solium]|eukprot:TsM_000688300 transcript=TsM_000688300 gene=TsM_000688300